MIRWTDDPQRPITTQHKRPDRRDWRTFLVAFLVALVVIGGLIWTAQDAAAAQLPKGKAIQGRTYYCGKLVPIPGTNGQLLRCSAQRVNR